MFSAQRSNQSLLFSKMYGTPPPLTGDGGGEVQNTNVKLLDFLFFFLVFGCFLAELIVGSFCLSLGVECLFARKTLVTGGKGY